jgi:hypothetical protein
MRLAVVNRQVVEALCFVGEFSEKQEGTGAG